MSILYHYGTLCFKLVGYQQDNEAKDHFHVHPSDTAPCLSCSSENTSLRYQLTCLEESFFFFFFKGRTH